MAHRVEPHCPKTKTTSRSRTHTLGTFVVRAAPRRGLGGTICTCQRVKVRPYGFSIYQPPPVALLLQVRCHGGQQMDGPKPKTLAAVAGACLLSLTVAASLPLTGANAATTDPDPSPREITNAALSRHAATE